MLNNYNEILTPDEVCEILLIGKNSFYDLIHSNQLQAYRIGRNWRVTKQAVINFINKKTVGAD